MEESLGDSFGFVSTEEASETACRSVPGLSGHQRQLCLQNPGLLWAMADGTQLGLYECVHQFQFHKWNCSVAKVIHGKTSTDLTHPGQHRAAGLVTGLHKATKKGMSKLGTDGQNVHP